MSVLQDNPLNSREGLSMMNNLSIALNDGATSPLAISFVNQLVCQPVKDLAVLKTVAEKLLVFLEVQIEYLFRANRDWVYIGSRLAFIVGQEVLLAVAGCVSEMQYRRQTMKRLGIGSEAAKKFLDTFRAYQNSEMLFIQHNIDLGFNAKALEEKKLFSKLLLLDKAFGIKCNPLNLQDSQDTVFLHFLNDSLRDFKRYIDPKGFDKANIQKQMREFRHTLKEHFQMHEQVHLLTFTPSLNIDSHRLNEIIESIK